MRADIDHFVVMTPTGDVDDKASVHVYLALTDRLLSSLRLTEPGKLTVRMRAGITHIRGLIVENALTPGEAYNFTFTIDNPPPMGELKRKECTYQEHARVGSDAWRRIPVTAPQVLLRPRFARVVSYQVRICCATP